MSLFKTTTKTYQKPEPKTRARVQPSSEGLKMEAGIKFGMALAAVQANKSLFIQPKTGGQIGRRGFQYTNLKQIMDVVRPILAEHNFIVHWDTETDDGMIKVTCILEHAPTAFHMKSSIRSPYKLDDVARPEQSLASVITFLRRYTLQLVLNIVCIDDPDSDTPADYEGDYQQSGPTRAAPRTEARRVTPPKPVTKAEAHAIVKRMSSALTEEEAEGIKKEELWGRMAQAAKTNPEMAQAMKDAWNESFRRYTPTDGEAGETPNQP